MEPTDRKLLDRVRDALRLKHFSIRAEEACVSWIKGYTSGLALQSSVLTTGIMNWAAGESAWRRY